MSSSIAAAVTTSAMDGVSAARMEETEPKICEPGGRGMIFPFVESEQQMENTPRAIIYALVMIYLFLGVSVVADVFMSSIQMITSSTKRILVKGTTSRYITVKKWNPTVANLTLMALGSSAPEILLSIVEIVRNEFTAGDLGPSTIVGSAAFNLFMIIAVCIVSIPSPEIRLIKETGVFFVTAVFSVLAYIWLVLIVLVTSPDVIEIWEGVVTLVLFPILTFVSHRADVGWFARKGGDQAPTLFQEPGAVINSFKSICDAKGNAIENPAGVLTFQSDYMEVSVGEESVEETIPVFRCNGRKGSVSCKYRTVSGKAVADRDFCSTHGELYFDHGVSMQEFSVTLLHKEKWESDDYFQIRLEDSSGGAIFNPLDDGGEECCVLTIQLRNKNRDALQRNYSYKVRNFVDSHLNVDMMSIGWKKWKANIKDSICEVSEEEVPSCFDWIFHIISMPWKFMFSLLCPPAEYCWGWLCFFMALFWIGAMTAIIIDFAELFGCVTTLKDAVTAITFVALGTSMPDLFASITAAAEDEYADASIVNVTGSNSVNVFLGIGIPWTMAAIYWQVMGATPEWKVENASFLNAHPQYRNTGAFVVLGGDLAFGVAVFTVAALIGLGIIRGRRLVYGGELGGPSASKWASGGCLASLWFFYIALATWKSYDVSASFNRQMAVLLIGIYAVAVFMFLLGIGSKIVDCAKMLRGSEDAEDGEDVPLTGTSCADGDFKAHENLKHMLEERPALPQADVTIEVEEKLKNIVGKVAGEEVAPLLMAQSDGKPAAETSGQAAKELGQDPTARQAAAISNGRAPGATAAAPPAASPAAPPAATLAASPATLLASTREAPCAAVGAVPGVGVAGVVQKPELTAAAAGVELQRGMRVRVVGTSQTDLNDQIGEVYGLYEEGEASGLERRWKVVFADGQTRAALRRCNLEVVPGPEIVSISPVVSASTQPKHTAAAAASVATATVTPAAAPAGVGAETATSIASGIGAVTAAPLATGSTGSQAAASVTSAGSTTAAATVPMTVAAASASTTAARSAAPVICPNNVPRADQRAEPATGSVTDVHNPLHIAVLSGSEVQVSKLLGEGADVNVSTPEDLQTPLHLAVVHGYKSIVQRLLDAGATGNAPNAQGETPLHLTAYYGRLDIAGALLKARAQVNAQDVRERSALHVAAMRSQDAVAEVLLNAGAELNAKTGTGYTPLAMAQDWGSSSIAQLLEKRGGWRRSGPGDHDDAQPPKPVQNFIDIRVPQGAPGTTIQVPLPSGSFVSVQVPSSAQVNEIYRIQIPSEVAGPSAAAVAKLETSAQPRASSEGPHVAGKPGTQPLPQAAARPAAQVATPQPAAQAVTTQPSTQAAALAKDSAKPEGQPAVQPATQTAAQPATQQAAQPSMTKPTGQPVAASAALPSATTASAPLADATPAPASSSSAPAAREPAASLSKVAAAATQHGAGEMAAPSTAGSSTTNLGAVSGPENRSSAPAKVAEAHTGSSDRSVAPASGAAASSTAASAAAEEAARVEWV